jgi:hypothetical protein
MSGDFGLPDLSPPISLRIGIGITTSRFRHEGNGAARTRALFDYHIALRHRIFNARVISRLIDNQATTLIAMKRR